jgi:tight adherence protein C
VVLDATGDRPMIGPTVAAMAAATVVGVGWRCRPRPPTRRPAAPGEAIEHRRRPSHRRRDTRIVVAGVGVVAVAIAPELVVPVVTILALWIMWRPRVERRRTRERIERELPDAVDLLVLAVRAGLTPAAAVREVADTTPAPVGSGFARVVHRLDRGETFADAIVALRDDLGPPADALVDVITTTTRYGLPLEPVLDQLVAEAREARRRHRQADARRLPIRLSFPLVTCTLPSFVLLAIVPAVIAALSSLGPSAW